MTKQLQHIPIRCILALTAVVAWVACTEDHLGDRVEPHPGTSTPVGQYPIAFSSATADQETETRASESTLGHDFLVYGYKNVAGQQQTVFNGYTVWYREGSGNTSEDNTHGYFYVGGEQTIKYWDFSATEYHFWGVWDDRGDLTEISDGVGNSKVLTIHDVPLRVGEPADRAYDVLYSTLVERRSVTTDVVQFNFKRPYAQLRVQFYTSEPLEGDDQIDLSAIRFAPDPAATSPQVNKVYAKGDVIVTYPLTAADCPGYQHETVEVRNLSNPQDELFFEDVILNATYGTTSNTAITAPVADSDGLRLDDMPGTSLTRAGEVPGKKYFYYPLPMGELNPAFIMTLRIHGDTETKTAVVPANFMQWKPNFLYTYIFKITEAGKKIEFYDVRIEPWHYGGSQEEEWKNW